MCSGLLYVDLKPPIEFLYSPRQIRTKYELDAKCTLKVIGFYNIFDKSRTNPHDLFGCHDHRSVLPEHCPDCEHTLAVGVIHNTEKNY